MTLEQISTCWEAGLARAERECDQAYRIRGGSATAREKLEHYFFLMRVCACRSPLAKVNSLGAAAALSAKGFRPWTLPEIAQLCDRDFGRAWPHADPPGGDGMLLRWIEALFPDTPERKEVLGQAIELFGKDARWQPSGLTTFLEEERTAMPTASSWMDEPSSGNYWKPGAGRFKCVITGEAQWVVSQRFGKKMLEIPTDKGILSTTQESLIAPLRDYGQRHKKRTVGATLTFSCNGAAGTEKRYEKVEVK